MISTPQTLQNIIYVGDISISLNENDIRQYFSQFGFIISSRFDFNAYGNRYGFLRYAESKSVDAAIKNANHVCLFGSKPIRVTRWRDPKSFGKENNVFVMNIPSTCDTKLFDEVFSKYGPIFSSKLTATGYGYVEYTSKESATKCIEEGKVPILGVDVIVSEYQSKSNRGNLNNNLYVKNLPELKREELEEKLQEIFGRFGEIRSMLVIENKTDRKPFAFICYSKVESAENALKSLHHTNPFEEENFLEIIFANNRKEVESLNQTNIVIKNIKPSVNQQQLLTIFSQFGEIIRIMKTSREGVPTHAAFIRFKKPEQATQAIINSTKDENIKSIFDGRIYITYLQDKKTRKQYKEMLNRSAKINQARPKVEAPFMPMMPQYSNPQMMGLIPPVVNMPFPNMNLNMGNPQINMMGGNFQHINPQNQFGIAGNQVGMYPEQSQMIYSQGNQPMMPSAQNYQFQRQGQGQGNMQYNNQKRGGYQGYRGGPRYPRGGSNNPRRSPPPPQTQPPLPPSNFMDAKRLIDSIDDLEYEQKEKTDQNRIVGSIIYRIIVMKTNEGLAPKITGMIIDMDLKSIKEYMENEQKFDNLITEAIEIWSRDQAEI